GEGHGRGRQRQLVEAVGIGEHRLIATGPHIFEDGGDRKTDLLGDFALAAEQRFEFFGEAGVAGVEPKHHQAECSGVALAAQAAARSCRRAPRHAGLSRTRPPPAKSWSTLPAGVSASVKRMASNSRTPSTALVS